MFAAVNTIVVWQRKVQGRLYLNKAPRYSLTWSLAPLQDYFQPLMSSTVKQGHWQAIVPEAGLQHCTPAVPAMDLPAGTTRLASGHRRWSCGV